MTEYVKKDGEGACFKKVSKNGTSYYNGSFKLDEKEYWISLFPKKSQSGEQYVSFSIQPRQAKETQKNVNNEVKDEFGDTIPF